MKFSDLVVLGSTIITFDSTMFLEDRCGCLIGMAYASETGATNAQPGDLRKQYPWLWEIHLNNRCPVCHEFMGTYAASISCVAAHVEEKTWSFEQALEYIHSIEPKEESADDDVALENVRA